jgi:hypothetical protein
VADRQAHAQAARFRRVERLEQAIGLQLAEPDARVLDRDDRPRVIIDGLVRAADDEPPPLGRDIAHGLGRIDEEVDEHLLELNAIAQNRWQVHVQ